MDAVSRVFNDPHEALIRRTETGRWPKGVSGNPHGRPKKERMITKLCEEIMEENRDEIKAQIIRSLTMKGMAGVLLFRELAERVEGKVTQGIELSGTVNAMTDAEIMDKLAALLDVKVDEPERIPEPDQVPAK
jgi:hypothetical protein